MNRSMLCVALLSVAATSPVMGAEAAGTADTRQVSAVPDHKSAGSASLRSPLDAQAAVPQVITRLSLKRYRTAEDAQVGSWRQANDAVARAGGWRAYARLSQTADDVEPAKPPQEAATLPSPAGNAQQTSPADKADHAGHGKSGAP